MKLDEAAWCQSLQSALSLVELQRSGQEITEVSPVCCQFGSHLSLPSSLPAPAPTPNPSPPSAYGSRPVAAPPGARQGAEGTLGLPK